MRILTCISILLAFFSMNVSAVEPIDEQQIMLYYQIPLGAGKAQDNKHQFGLRLDQVTHEPGEDVHISTLEGRTAAMDLRMDYDGIRSLKIHGVDYASYLIARAAEGEQAPAEAAPAGGEATTETSGAPQEEKTTIQQKLDELPFGVVIGVLLGIGIIAGVGG